MFIPLSPFLFIYKETHNLNVLAIPYLTIFSLHQKKSEQLERLANYLANPLTVWALSGKSYTTSRKLRMLVLDGETRSPKPTFLSHKTF